MIEPVTWFTRNGVDAQRFRDERCAHSHAEIDALRGVVDALCAPELTLAEAKECSAPQKLDRCIMEG